jgi:DNA topoisomerase-2
MSSPVFENTFVTESIVVAKKGKGETDSDKLAKQYQKKTDRQHILDNPDTYIGSVENVDANMWVFDDDTGKIVLRQIEYIPGLYKLFDEGIVNCRDHVIRMIQSNSEDKKCVSYIETTISDDGVITFRNDGNGIDVARHPEYDVWIPEMVFGHLRTSTNYDKTEKKIVGGKNGFGFKLVLIWSEFGSIETVDHVRGLKYTQEFKNNLSEIVKPTVTKIKGGVKPYTSVSFKPDYARLKTGGLTPDMLSILKKRIYDIGAVTDHSVKKIKVVHNGETIPVKNFQQYVDLYIGSKEETKRVYESPNDRWEYAVALSPTQQFEQISFANGICTFKGGKHVDYIMGQITRKVVAYIEKKKKIVVHPNTIREQLILFLRCDVENPAFDSQTKDFMNTPSSGFGSTCHVSDAFIEKLAKMGIMEAACSISVLKEARLAKKTDGTKTRNIRGIANFIDANFAGGPQSKDCILILCEGLSAMSGVVSGLSPSDRNTIGVYPLKGKLLNVRGEQIKRISENKEISDVKKILALESGKEYSSSEDVNQFLRYGKVMILTDSDVDGSHIKALCINLFHSEWASLFRISGFLSFMNTPILTARRGANTLQFYNEGEYVDWKNSLGSSGISGWTVKYFKGLGTSTSKEFKQYFADKKIVDFVYGNDDDDIDKVFNKKRADERKTWLGGYDKTAYLNTSHATVNYKEFVDKELIHFSVYDCERSIPNMVDGLKISQRKILFAAFKRKMTSEIKVAQFSGYVSEHSCYHHGEASLNGAIVNMAQDFVGSNNINLLEPHGQFGSRQYGGDDSASERYIFTQLNPLTRKMFPVVDDTILSYKDDDGTVVEPDFYIPIIPFALINGISGIGTGFSTSIPSYNPAQIIEYLLAKLNNSGVPEHGFIPFYEGFKGTVSKLADQKYMAKGVYVKVSETSIRITELPIGTWTMPYIGYLESLEDGGVDKKGKKILPEIRDFVSLSTEKIVDIIINFPRGKIAELEGAIDSVSGINGIEKLLKLSTTISTTNIHLFDKDCKLRKYASVEEIIDDFYVVRLDAYRKRKACMISELERQLVKLSNRARYIQLNLSGIIDLRGKSNVAIVELLKKMEFKTLSGDGDYDYLIKMPMNSVSQENVDKLMREKTDTELELETLSRTTLEDMWQRELMDLKIQYELYLAKRHVDDLVVSKVSSVKVSVKRAKK